MYGPKLSHDELVSIGALAANALQIKLDRDARRRKPVMIKWFEEHWIQIQPILWSIKLERTEDEQ
jgi:predicted oxidoreductase